ncbi:MAG: hypothetical protein IPK16_21745 [Anaerolineales bacterium]|nr:hypothetical protein [Anaerolineales bacterium]
MIISVPTYQNLMAGFDYRGQDIQVTVVAPATSRFVTMTVGSCVQAGDYAVSLVDLRVNGPQRGEFVVTKPVTATINSQRQYPASKKRKCTMPYSGPHLKEIQQAIKSGYKRDEFRHLVEANLEGLDFDLLVAAALEPQLQGQAAA